MFYNTELYHGTNFSLLEIYPGCLLTQCEYMPRAIAIGIAKSLHILLITG